MIAYLDCSTGVSGDKFLGALLDAGSASGAFTAEYLQVVLSALAPEACVVVERVRSHGIAAVSVRVEAAGPQPEHRHWPEVRAMLETSALEPAVRGRALRTFELLAHAEAHAHACAVDDVHFHEVGALDSILDVVGVCAGLHALGVTHLMASPVAVGSGTVETAHGTLPVPAPATAQLLQGIPIVPGSAAGELTTPTGAALLAACADAYGPCPPMTPRVTGTGAGTRDIGVPNVCQLILGDPAREQALDTECVTLLETNVDHLSGEAVADAIGRLLAQGALDAWATPITMKKGRPALLLSVLAPGTPDDAAQLAERIVAFTGTLGVRTQQLERFAVPRDVAAIDTPWGPVRVKVGAGRMRPEADDVARVAGELSQPYREVER